jgi:hypothetical protein
LPVSVQIRENGQERKEGTYAVSLNDNIGIEVVEKCCRKIASISDSISLVEARKLEPDLECFCTIPKSKYQMEIIEQGAKYELVFEDKSAIKIPKKTAKVINQEMEFEPTSSYIVENELLSKLFSRNCADMLPDSTPSINSPLNWACRDVESVRRLPVVC